MGCGYSGGGGGRQKPGTPRGVVQAGLRGQEGAACKELRASTGTCCVTGLQSKSRESQAESPCMGTAFPFLRVAQCSGAGTCSRSRVGGLRRPALRARTLESIRKRAPARYSLAAASHTGAPGSGGGRSVAGGLRLHVHRALPAGGSRGVLSPVGWSGHPARPVGGLSPSTDQSGGAGSLAQGVVRALR